MQKRSFFASRHLAFQSEVDGSPIMPQRGDMGERLIVGNIGEHDIPGDAAVVKDDGTVHGLPAVFQVVRNGQDGSPTGMQPVDVVDQQIPGDRIDRIGRLVQHDDVRVEQHARHQTGTPAHAAGQPGHPRIEERTQFERPHQRFPAEPGGGHASRAIRIEQQATEPDIVPDAHRTDEIRMLRHQEHIPHRRYEHAVDDAASASWTQQSRNEFEQRRLAHAVIAEDGHRLALGNREGNVIQHGLAPAVPERDMFHRDGHTLQRHPMAVSSRIRPQGRDESATEHARRDGESARAA